MSPTTRFLIGGDWVAPRGTRRRALVDPATEEVWDEVAMADSADVACAVQAAAQALPGWAATDPAARGALLERLATGIEQRAGEIAAAITREMGAPVALARGNQIRIALQHLRTFAALARSHPFEGPLRPDAPQDRILHQPIGVCALITPWNWPLNQIAQKVGAAMAAGCTVVLKPSEQAPLSAALFGRVMADVGVPAGVFNLIQGDAEAGEALARHPGVRMVSLTGSGRAGAAVSVAAAPTVKRVVLELGGKGPNLIFADTDVEAAVALGTAQCFANSGQSCNAPTRMLVERSVYARAVEIAAETARATPVGDPAQEGPHLGPLASARQFETVQRYIRLGIDEGARLVAGGPGRPEGMTRGYFARPTVFADVAPGMRIAREEIFGPVLSILPFDSEAEAIGLANDSDFGLAAYVQTGDPARAARVARAVECGVVVLNRSARAPGSPFGGVKQSGNGREGGRWGLEEFLEVKAVAGWPEG
ncbi:MAG: aldehyde dehydrogenase family protein [Gemmobacter sp.]